MSDLDSATAILATATEAPEITPDSPHDQPTPDQSTDVSDSASDAVDSPSTEEGADDKPGQKPLPTTNQIRQALKAFRESNTEHSQAARMLQDGYGRYEAYKEVFPTVDEARSVAAQLSTIGGLEGLAEMQSVITSVEETDGLLEAGDPKVLDRIAEDAPEGFVKLAPSYLSKLQKMNPEVFGQTLQPYLVQGMEAAGLPNVLRYLSAKLSEKPELASLAEIAKNALDWISEQKSLAERFNRDALNPERQKVQEAMSQVEKERRDLMNSNIGNNVGPHIRQELGTRLRPYAESLKALPQGQRDSVARACIETLKAALESDKAYQTQINAMMNARQPNQAKIIAFNKQKVTALADKVIESVVKSYGLKAGTAPVRRTSKPANDRQRTQTNNDQPKQFVQLSQPPKESEIDWNHKFMNEQAYIQHRAILKDGRWVKW